MPTLEERVTALEQKVENLSTWVIYWDGDKYRYCNLGHAKRYSINYDPTMYSCANDARMETLRLNGVIT